MSWKRLIWALPIISIFSDSAMATCEIDDAAFQGAITEIEKNYEDIFERRRTKVEQEIVDIREDSPDPNDAEAVVGFEIETDWTLQEIKLHVPEFSLEDKRIVFGVPTVAMREQTWIYHTPSVRMEQRCINNPPETVCKMESRCVGGGWSRICTDIPVCHMRAGGQSCTDLPVPFMQEQRTILHVPETRMEQQEVVLGIPVVEMKLQSWKLHLPQFKLSNISVETRKIVSDVSAYGTD